MNAALGCVSLSHVDEAIARRREIVEAYRADLADVASVRFQAPAQAGSTHTYKDLGVLFETGAQRAAVEAALRDEAIETKRYFLPVHHMDAYKQWRDVDLPATEAVYDTVLCLPLFHELTDEDRTRIVAAVRKAVG